MARVPYLDVDDLPEDQRGALARRPINLNRAMANSIGALTHFGAVGRWIRHECTLDPRLREMAIIQVGYLTRTAYEYSHHVKIARDFGVTDDDVHAITAETEGRATTLAELDRAVLRAAREMTTDIALSDATFAVLARHLSHEHVVDLTVVIAFYCGVVRLLSTLQIDNEPEYAAMLDQFPLPKG